MIGCRHVKHKQADFDVWALLQPFGFSNTHTNYDRPALLFRQDLAGILHWSKTLIISQKNLNSDDDSLGVAISYPRLQTVLIQSTSLK